MAALVVGLGLAAYWLIGFSSLLAVRQVQVDGVSLVSADDVRAAAAVPAGQPLARVDEEAVAARVTAALPAVAAVKITRHWPSTLVITVTERVAVYQVSAAGAYNWVSADGVVFHTSADAQPVPSAIVALGDQTLLRDVATVVAALPAELAGHVLWLAAPTRDSISLQLDGDRQVVWGSAEQSDLKAQVIVALLNVPGHVYDVSAPAHPAVR